MTNSAEGQLEAAIWDAMSKHKVTCHDAPPFVDALLAAARAYAAGDSDELTQMRRDVLHRDAAPGSRAEQTPASDCGGASRTATELHPSGSVASRSNVAGRGATVSTGASIPEPRDQRKRGVIHMWITVIHRVCTGGSHDHR